MMIHYWLQVQQGTNIADNSFISRPSRLYATVLRPSVCLSVRNVLWLNGAS